MKKVLLFCFICLGLFACHSKDPFKDEIILEYGESISTNVQDYLLDDISQDEKSSIVDNAQVLVSNADVVKNSLYPSVGTYQVKITYNHKDKFVDVLIKDTTKPVFKEFKDSIETYLHVKVDFISLFKVDDLSKVKLTFDDSKVDYSRAGDYQMNVTASDEYDNQISKEVTLHIKEPKIILNQQNYHLKVGDSFVIRPIIKGPSQQVTYKSSQPQNVIVNKDGKVIAKNKGKAIIDVIANGVMAQCHILVEDKKISTPSNKPTHSKPQNKVPASTDQTKPSIVDSEFNLSIAKEAFRLHNEERQKAGLSKLSWRNNLYQAAQIRAKEVAYMLNKTGELTHTRPNGQPFYTVLTSYRSCGENIAMGYTSASGVMNGWMNSHGHRSNILGDYTSMAVAYYNGFWVSIFIS